MGGYDEEGDYTGSGEYDANMTYVAKPPQKKPWQKKETGRVVTGKMAAYDGVSEYDRDGNYVGTLEDYRPRQKAPETEQTPKIQMLRVRIPKIRKMKKILQTAAWTASGKRLITAVIWETGLRIMMKIRTAITVMSTIMSKDKKSFLNV